MFGISFKTTHEPGEGEGTEETRWALRLPGNGEGAWGFMILFSPLLLMFGIFLVKET